MAGTSPVGVQEQTKCALMMLSRSKDRAEVDRARTVQLTFSGWTSAMIGEAFGVREDTVRQWRSLFIAGGVATLKTRKAPGAVPVNCLPVNDRVTGRYHGEHSGEATEELLGSIPW